MELVLSILQEAIPDSYRKYGFYNFNNNFTVEHASAVAKCLDIKRLQCKKPINKEVWRLINEELLTIRPDITVRIHGYYAQVCDLSFLAELTNVQSLSIDGILESRNVEYISRLSKLSKLTLDINDLKAFDFLNSINDNLIELDIGRTNSKKPDLKVLERFRCLEFLALRGQNKNIEVLSTLSSLNEISLSGTTVGNFKFLHKLNKLDSLNLDLIKSSDFDSVNTLNIKSLSVSEIRGLEDLSFISGFPHLQSISLDCLNKVEKIPSLSSEHSLRRVFIDNMKKLSDIKGLYACVHLEDFIFRNSTTPLSARDFIPIIHLGSLKYAAIGTGSVKKNDEIDRLLNQAKIDRYEYYDFVFK
jgi:hypothetical protein